MRVTMRTTSAGPAGTMLAGREYEVPDDEARDLIGCGAATPVNRGTKVARAERAVGTDAAAKTAGAAGTDAPVPSPNPPRSGRAKPEQRKQSGT